MPVARVQLDDGRVGLFEVPEGTTPEEIESFDFSKLVPTEQPSAMASFAKGLPVGAVHGTASLADLGAEGMRRASSFGPLVGMGEALLNRAGMPRDSALDMVKQFLEKPKGTAGGYGYSIGEMIPSTVAMTPGLGMGSKALSAIGSGAGAEAAGRISSGGEDEGQNPLARIAGALVGGVPAIFKQTRWQNADEMLRDATAGLSKEDFTEARRLAKTLTDMDMPYTNAQLFGLFSPLPSLQQRISENPRVMPLLFDRLKSAPDKAKNWADLSALEVGSLGVGRRESASALQEAAEGALRQIRGKARGEYAKNMPLPFNYPQEQVGQLHSALLREADNYLPNSSEAKALKEFAKTLVKGHKTVQVPQWSTNPAGQKMLQLTEKEIPVFETGSEQINNMYKSLTVDSAKFLDNPTFKSLPLLETRALWKQFTPEFQPARDAYRKVMEQEFNPVSRSLTGDVARSGGGSEAERITARESMFGQVFPKDRAQPQAITGLARDTAGQKDAFADFIAEHIRKSAGGALDRDFGVHGGAEAKLKSPAVLKDALVGSGSSGMQVNMETALSEVAKQQGKNPRDVVKGFQNAMDALSTYANVGVSNRLSAMEIARTAEKNIATRALTPSRTARSVEDLVRGGQYRKVADVLLSPQGIDKLEKLSKFAPMSGVAQATLADLLNAALQADGKQGQINQQ